MIYVLILSKCGLRICFWWLKWSKRVWRCFGAYKHWILKSEKWYFYWKWKVGCKMTELDQKWWNLKKNPNSQCCLIIWGNGKKMPENCPQFYLVIWHGFGALGFSHHETLIDGTIPTLNHKLSSPRGARAFHELRRYQTSLGDPI